MVRPPPRRQDRRSPRCLRIHSAALRELSATRLSSPPAVALIHELTPTTTRDPRAQVAKLRPQASLLSHVGHIDLRRRLKSARGASGIRFSHRSAVPTHDVASLRGNDERRLSPNQRGPPWHSLSRCSSVPSCPQSTRCCRDAPARRVRYGRWTCAPLRGGRPAIASVAGLPTTTAVRLNSDHSAVACRPMGACQTQSGRRTKLPGHDEIGAALPGWSMSEHAFSIVASRSRNTGAPAGKRLGRGHASSVPQPY